MMIVYSKAFFFFHALHVKNTMTIILQQIYSLHNYRFLSLKKIGEVNKLPLMLRIIFFKNITIKD